jgi:hypothetical protein
VIPGIRLLKVPDPVTIDQLQFIRNLPSSGFALFAAENLDPDLQTLLHRIQGPTTEKKGEPLPHRQPFKTASIRFQSLRQEWNFLLRNNFLAMEEGTLKTWGQEVDAMAESFDRLVTTPTLRNFTLTRNDLKRFRERFDYQMRSNKDIPAYQVQVWKNRLESLQRLLAYGQRVELPR